MGDLPRGFWVVLAAAVSAVVVIVGLIGWGLNPSGVKSRLIAEVERATGRTMTISGGIGVKFSLVPTVTLDDVALSNPPGFARPDMVKVARVELSLGLAPLLQHQIEIDHISLVRPDIQLETNQAGSHNWVFTREPTQVAAEPHPAAGPGGSPGGNAVGNAGGSRGVAFAVSFLDSTVVDGRIAWVDGASGRRIAARVPQVSVVAPAGGPAQLTGTVNYDGQTIELSGRADLAEVASDNGGTPAYPVSLKLESGGASVAAVGQIARPREAKGYAFEVDADVPDPSRFASFLPSVPLASLKAVTVHADVKDGGGPVPDISVLNVKVRSVALDTLTRGAFLSDVRVSARDQAPIYLEAQVVVPGFDTDSGVTGTVGDLAWLAHGATGPVSVDLEWNAASARASVAGTIQEPMRFAGFALDARAIVPNPSLLIDRAPDTLKSVAFRARVTDAPGPIPFQFTSSAGDLTGELSLARDPRFVVSGTVSSQRLDLDALRLRPASQAAGTDPGVPVEPEAHGKATEVIPDTRLPFDLIRMADADVKFTFGQLRAGGADINGVDAVLSAKDGVMRLDPFTIAAPNERLNAALTVDDAKTPPLVHLTVQSPGFALRPLLAVLGMPQVANGPVEVRADLSGTGDTPRALAASLDGWADVAIEGGQLDARLINTWLAGLRPLHIDGADVTNLRCFAVRADAKGGVVAIQPMALNTAALIIEGAGDVDLGHETLSLRLRPRTKIGGTGIALPVRVSGPMGAPSARIDISPGGGGPGGSGLAGLLLGGKDIMGAAGGGDPCPAALARARGGAPPSGAEAPAAPGGK
ncbi:MAG: AsmA family protein [Acetobacteraceae bacterium]